MINNSFLGFRTGLISIVLLINFSTKLAAQDSLSKTVPASSKHFFTARTVLIPGSLITAGAISGSGRYVISNPEIKEERDEHFSGFRTRVDNFLQFAPVAAGYGMLLRHPQHRFWPYTKKVVLNEIIMMAMVFPTKQIVGERRPDTGTPNSFPSGHTAQAFSGATLFCDEFAAHDFWLKAAVYSGASAVGVLRVLNNRHWAGDVVAGAGFGILSAKLSKWIIEPHGRKPVISQFVY